ncbi:MAG: N-acetyltransferase [Rhodobacteraceae bacterium]|nr:MAG: N-acetyltransferase [Paracoccaceae bacterium]
MTRLSVDIPVIETDRLRLREPRDSDLEAHIAFMAGERSAMVGGPQDRFLAQRGFVSSLGHWLLRGYGMWVMALKSDDTPIGRMGFIFYEGWDEPEIGWHVYDGFEGKGYVFEAARAALQTGAVTFGLDGVVSYIDPANSRSAALAERLGAAVERDGTLLGKPCQVWRHRKQAEAL